MNRSYYLQLIAEAKEQFKFASDEQKVRIYEKLQKLSKKVQLPESNTTKDAAPIDFLDEK